MTIKPVTTFAITETSQTHSQNTPTSISCSFCLGTWVPRHRDGIVQPYVRRCVRTYVCTYVRLLAYRVQYFCTS